MDSHPSILQQTILELASVKATEDLLTATETAFDSQRIIFLLGNFMLIQSFLARESFRPLTAVTTEALVSAQARTEIVQTAVASAKDRHFQRYVYSLAYFDYASSDEERRDYGLEVSYRKLPRTAEVRKSTYLSVERFILRHLIDQ